MSAILRQRIEGAPVFVAALVLVLALGWGGALGPRWWALALFVAPDLSFAGHPAGPRVGAAVHNVARL